MGIKGLSSFMTQNPDICKPFKLHDTLVVIDGSNLIHSLYYNNKLDFRYGGEYKRYYDCVKRFMSSFLQCNIKPIVIFDGAQEKSARKLKSSLERTKNTLERAHTIVKGQKCSYPVFPLLSYEVFYSVLFDLGVPLANCDFAADGQVAVLGNYYDCPVISNDSDFFIFDAHKGFIHMDSINTTINLDIGSDGKEYKFLNCKIYYIDEFVKAFHGLAKNVLPLFGTLLGNEFIEPEIFDNFFAKIQLPDYNSGRLSFDLRHKKNLKMVGLLGWLRYKTLCEAINEVSSYFEVSEQENIKSLIDISVCGYKLNPCSLTFIFDQNISDPRNDLLSNTMLITPCGNPLPQNFVLKFHQGHLCSFLINVIGLHRVFLQAQVEDMKLKSAHSCSSYIRQVLYGILVRHDLNGTECMNKDCLGYIEEYDRQESSIQKKKILPLFSVKGFGQLPKINEIQGISKKQCIAIIAEALGVSSYFFLHIPDTWQLLIGSINYWLRISGCRSEGFISALILNLIYFGLIKCKKSFHQHYRCPKKARTRSKCNCTSISCIAVNVSESDLKYAGKKLEEYYFNPSLYLGRSLFLNTVHSFSQLQSCLLHATFLNQLLNDCLMNVYPDKCFSGTMIYNLTKALASCSSAELFIANILGKDLNLLFTRLKSKVCENIPNFNFSRRKTES